MFSFFKTPCIYSVPCQQTTDHVHHFREITIDPTETAICSTNAKTLLFTNTIIQSALLNMAPPLKSSFLNETQIFL